MCTHISRKICNININQISGYHVNIELVKTAERRLCDGPERENEANGGEGALASGQRAHITQVGLVSLTGLHLQRRRHQFTLYQLAKKL